MKVSVVIVAGGAGKRMGTNTPKQFLLLKKQPILMHTIRSFYEWNSETEIIVVLPEKDITNWKQLCEDHHFNVPHKTVVGGRERFHSVKNGIMATTGDIIGIHDGVRPLASNNTISACFQEASLSGAAIPVVPVKESLRKFSLKGNHPVDRNAFRCVQTPQCFKKEVLDKAFEQSYDPIFTDDATVVEKAGFTVSMVTGNEENIKITTPVDLELANVLVK